ncbi:type I toxin-antitoxin system Fst family toxin [Staphylococcus epidermidis]
MEGGGNIMSNTLFVTIIAPIVVRVILTLFSHWLNNREE